MLGISPCAASPYLPPPLPPPQSPKSFQLNVCLSLPLGNLSKPPMISCSLLHHMEIIYSLYIYTQPPSPIPTQLGFDLFSCVVKKKKKKLLENFRWHKSRENSILNHPHPAPCCLYHPDLTVNILPVLFHSHFPNFASNLPCPQSTLFFFIYLWLHRVIVAAQGIFRCGTQASL